MSAAPTQKLTPDLLADLCLTHLTQNPEQLADFMHEAGYTGAGLRRAVGSPELNNGLIDYFARHELLMLTVCADNAVTAGSFMGVWQQLNRSE